MVTVCWIHDHYWVLLTLLLQPHACEGSWIYRRQSTVSTFPPSIICHHLLMDSRYMTVPLYVVAFAIAVPTCILADRLPGYRPIMAGLVLVLGSIFCALSAGIYAYVPRYVFLCFINSAIWTANPLALSYASVSMGPLHPETRAISLALINGFGNLAQIYGSYLFPGNDAPKYLKGFGTYAGLLFFGAAVYASAFVLFRKFPFKART